MRTLYEFCDYTLLNGDPATALAQPFALVLTESFDPSLTGARVDEQRATARLLVWPAPASWLAGRFVPAVVLSGFEPSRC